MNVTGRDKDIFTIYPTIHLKQQVHIYDNLSQFLISITKIRRVVIDPIHTIYNNKFHWNYLYEYSKLNSFGYAKDPNTRG